MNRRQLLKSTALAGVATSASVTALQAQAPQEAQFFELRTVDCENAEQRALVDAFWGETAIPLLNQLGVKPIGAFSEIEGENMNKLYLLIPYDSLALMQKAAFAIAQSEKASDYLNRKKEQAAYKRMESSLSIAFEDMKRLEVPAPIDQDRVFELRLYESPSEGMGMNKVKMFNDGEIPLMKKVGLGPVFFGQSLIGGQLPNLVYMVSSPTKEAHAENWKAFFADPVWKRLSGDAQYKGNVSRVVSTFLKRTAYSQI